MANGWGLTSDDSWLYATDGTENLYRIDPEGFAVEDTFTVHVEDEGERHSVSKLNELQYANKHIYANVYKTNYIVRIDPCSGQVTRVYDMTSLSNMNKEFVDQML